METYVPTTSWCHHRVNGMTTIPIITDGDLPFPCVMPKNYAARSWRFITAPNLKNFGDDWSMQTYPPATLINCFDAPPSKRNLPLLCGQIPRTIPSNLFDIDPHPTQSILQSIYVT